MPEDPNAASEAAVDKPAVPQKQKWSTKKKLAVFGGAAAFLLLIGIVNGANGSADLDPVSAPNDPPPAAIDEPAEDPEVVSIPSDLVGKTGAEAETALGSLGLGVNLQGDPSWPVVPVDPSGDVASQSTVTVTTQEPEPTYPSLEHENAVREAQNYVGVLPFSRAGLIDQLSSEYGGGYPVEVAQFAVDNIDVDWNAEAAEAAQQYLDSMPFSRDALFEQLTSSFGGQFTPEEANFGLAAVGY